MKFDHARHERHAEHRARSVGSQRRSQTRRPADPRRGGGGEAGAARARVDEPRRRRSRASRSSKGVVSGGGKTVTYGELIGDKLFNVRIAPRRASLPGAGAGEAGQPVQARRHARRAAGRHPGQGHGQVHLRPQHPLPGMLHGRFVRPRGQGAVRLTARLREAALGRRELDQAHPGRAGRPQGRLPRRRRADGVRRDPGGGAAEGEVGRRRRCCRAAGTSGSRCATHDAAGQGAGARSRVNDGQLRHRARSAAAKTCLADATSTTTTATCRSARAAAVADVTHGRRARLREHAGRLRNTRTS